MYRAIPEVNRICAMADRGRSYRLHQQALARIKNRPATFKNSDGISNNGSIPSYAGSSANDDGKSTYSRSTALLSKAQKEKQLQIYNENQKILKAIEYQSPTICRADLYEHELDHQRQVSRMTGKTEIYGFPVSKDKNSANLNKKNKNKKSKNFDPEIVRPMPKKFDIASFENSESNSKSSLSNKKPQNSSNKGSSNDGKLDDIFSSGANGLIDGGQNKNQQKPKKKPQKTNGKSNGDLGDIISGGVDALNSAPKTEDQKQDDKDDEKNDEDDDEKEDEKEDKDKEKDGKLDQIVGNGVNSLAGDAK